MTELNSNRSIDNDLAPIGAQFPLARPVLAVPPGVNVVDSTPSAFGLRFFQPTDDIATMSLPSFRYSSERQVAVADDGTKVPLIMTVEAAEKTTTGYSDGGKPRGEEFRIDFVGDFER